MLKALCVRRNVRLKHERYAAAEVAAAVYNVHRPPNSDAPLMSAWDFVRDGEQARQYADWLEAQRYVRKAIAQLPCDTPREQLMRIRQHTIDTLTRRGRTDAAELWAQAWPSLVPKEGE